MILLYKIQHQRIDRRSPLRFRQAADEHQRKTGKGSYVRSCHL
jgi:hypothetical protein